MEEFLIYETTVSDIGIFYADVSCLNIDDIKDKLSQYRLNKINNLKRDTDKKSSAGAELLLNYAMRKLYPGINIPMDFKTNQFGKPYIKGHSEIQFNLSHSRNIAICAVSKNCVGIDIEPVSRRSQAIAEKYFSDKEKEKMAEKDFAYVWTRKEAVAKAVGIGLGIGLADIDVSRDDVFIDEKLWHIDDVDLKISGFRASLCH